MIFKWALCQRCSPIEMFDEMEIVLCFEPNGIVCTLSIKSLGSQFEELRCKSSLRKLHFPHLVIFSVDFCNENRYRHSWGPPSRSSSSLSSSSSPSPWLSLRSGLGGRRNVQMQIQIEANPGDTAVSEVSTMKIITISSSIWKWWQWYIYNDEVYVCLSVCHVFACPNCQIAAPVGSHCAHLPLCIANNWKFIMIIMNVDVMMMMIDFKVPIYVDQIWNSSCLSVCFSQNYYFPPSWAP